MASNAVENAYTRVKRQMERVHKDLVATRNAQIQYLLKMRHTPFAIVISPEFVALFNFVRGAVKTMVTRLPPEMCAADGGITCTDLSVLMDGGQGSGGHLHTLPVSLAKSNSHADYLATRIVDLLDRPVTANDQDMTLNVRDDFVSNLSAIRYAFQSNLNDCQSESDKLKQALSDVRQELAASRTAAADGKSSAGHDNADLRKQIFRYEVLVGNLRKELEFAHDKGEKAIEKMQNELKELVARMNQTGRDRYGDEVLTLLRQAFERLQEERAQTLEAVQRVNVTMTRQPPSDTSHDSEALRRCEEEKESCRRDLESAHQELHRSLEKAEQCLDQLSRYKKELKSVGADRDKLRSHLKDCDSQLKQSVRKAVNTSLASSESNSGHYPVRHHKRDQSGRQKQTVSFKNRPTPYASSSSSFNMGPSLWGPQK